MPPKVEVLERTHVTVPAQIMEKIRKSAAEADRSISAEITRRLRESFERKQRT